MLIGLEVALLMLPEFYAVYTAPLGDFSIVFWTPISRFPGAKNPSQEDLRRLFLQLHAVDSTLIGWSGCKRASLGTTLQDFGHLTPGWEHVLCKLNINPF